MDARLNHEMMDASRHNTASLRHTCTCVLHKEHLNLMLEKLMNMCGYSTHIYYQTTHINYRPAPVKLIIIY